MVKNNKKRKKTPTSLMITGFGVLLVWMLVLNLVRDNVVLLDVPNNSGVSLLETIDTSLVSVFQDGKVVTWEWSLIPQKTSDFDIGTNQAVIMATGLLAGVNKTGKKLLTIYNLPSGQKQKEVSVGWEDQDIWLSVSQDKKTVALIRRNTLDNTGSVLYEFMTVQPEDDLIGSPVTLSIQQDSEDFVDYATDNNGVLYAVGSQKNVGRIVAVDLDKGTILWDNTFDNTKEFCSIIILSDRNALYAGNRDGILYKLDARNGQILKKIQLLEEGETRRITNDYSVLNLAFSPDSKYFAATINPKVYILVFTSETIVHTFSPADRLVSKIAFSPDNKFIATSDIRAGYPIKVWSMPQDK